MVSGSSSSSGDYESYVAHFADRVYFVVEESFCPVHFVGFRSFHTGYQAFSDGVIRSEYDLEGPLFDVFTPWPEKINLEKWGLLEGLIMKDAFQPIKGICEPWIKYGRDALEVCQDCRIAATFAGVGMNQIIPNPPSEDNSGSFELGDSGGSSIQILEDETEEVFPIVGDDVNNVEEPPLEIVEVSSDDEVLEVVNVLDEEEDADLEVISDADEAVEPGVFDQAEVIEAKGPSDGSNSDGESAPKKPRTAKN